MASMEELREVRLRKLQELRDLGIDPYPARVTRTSTVGEALSLFDVLTRDAEVVTLAGRVKGMRVHGGSTFLDIEDGTGTIQVFADQKNLGDETYHIVTDLIDMGDFIEVKGSLFTTNQGAETLRAQE